MVVAPPTPLEDLGRTVGDFTGDVGVLSAFLPRSHLGII